jgi:hypothetical protein
MNVIETRLSGRQATLEAVIRQLDRSMGQQTLARVELRYSSEAQVRLVPDKAKDAIRNLLLENGQKQVAVSVRSHDGPMDDATGDHVLRLYPVSQAEPARARPVAGRRTGFRGWLARWFPAFFPVGGVAADTPRQEPTVQATMGRKQVVDELRRAVVQGCAYHRAGGARGGLAPDPAAPVQAAQLIVRLPEMHAVLAAMLQAEQRSGHSFMRQALAAEGLAVSERLTVAYEFRERAAGDGTSYASDADVELLILPATTATASTVSASRAAGPAGGTLLPGAPSLVSAPAVGGTGTLMPAAPGTLVRVRVLGTRDAPFGQPLVLRFNTLPARLDRAALEDAGLGKDHAELLQVASNSAPLLLQSVHGGRLTVHAPQRSGADGAPLAMYYRHPSLVPLVGEVDLGPGVQTLLVNAPAGVLDTQSGRTLPALLVELTA